MTARDESDRFITAARKQQTAEELAETEAAVDTVKVLLAQLEARLEDDVDG